MVQGLAAGGSKFVATATHFANSTTRCNRGTAIDVVDNNVARHVAGNHDNHSGRQAVLAEATAATEDVGERLKTAHSLYVCKCVYSSGLPVIMMVIVMTLHITTLASCLTVAQLSKCLHTFTRI